jgi:5-methylcytosine-specific restriction protein A
MPRKPPTHRNPDVARGVLATRRAHDRARGNATQRGYDARWRAYAKALLARRPWCECDRCRASGDPLPARHVDHVIAVSGPTDPLFWLASNHRPMAHACHSRKTCQEDHGLGHRPRGQPPDSPSYCDNRRTRG